MQETWRKRRVLCRWTCLPLHYPSTGVNDRLLLFFSRKHPRYFCLHEIKTNKYMFYVICLCWVFDILLKWPYRWATTLGQTWNHRLHFLKTDTAFLETVTGDPWVPLLWGQSKPPCVYDLHSELERARLFGESGLVKTLLNTNYVLVKLTCCAVLWDGG